MPTEAPTRAHGLERYHSRLRASGSPIPVVGRVREVVGLYVEVEGIPGRLGEVCVIAREDGRPSRRRSSASARVARW